MRLKYRKCRRLLRDRDRIYGNEDRLRISSLQIEEVLTAPRNPWQSPYVCPHVRQISSVGTIVPIPHLGGLQHRYERTAA